MSSARLSKWTKERCKDGMIYEHETTLHTRALGAYEELSIMVESMKNGFCMGEGDVL